MVHYAVNRTLYGFKPDDGETAVPDLAEGDHVAVGRALDLLDLGLAHVVERRGPRLVVRLAVAPAPQHPAHQEETAAEEEQREEQRQEPAAAAVPRSG